MTVLPPGPHGGDAARLAELLGCPVDDVLDLSASLNPLAPDVRGQLRAAVDHLDRYPDDRAATEALAEAMGVDASRLVLTNGGAEAIALVAALHPTGWAEQRDFSLYRRHLRVLDPDAPRWMSDPNNPTGRLASPDERAAVRDEAFWLLATGTWTRADADTTVVGSLTKAWAVPGLRIGYVLAADADAAAAVRRLRPRWAVNGLACAALPTLLDRAQPVRWRDGIAELRRQLADVLRAHDLVPEPSDANYVWVPDAAGVRDALAERGILVRDGASFGQPHAVRIAVPGPAGLDRLQRALAEVADRARPQPEST